MCSTCRGAVKATARTDRSKSWVITALPDAQVWSGGVMGPRSDVSMESFLRALGS
jgi:hypothetical protein